MPGFDPKTTFSNKEYFHRKLTSEELNLRIEQLKRELHEDRITPKRLSALAAYLMPFFAMILFATWFVWH